MHFQTYFQILNRPEFVYPNDPTKLYTIIAVDLTGSAVSANDITFMVSNVPGEDVDAGMMCILDLLVP